MSNEFEWVAIAVVTIVSAARITRLLTFDAFPPIRWVREKIEDKLDGSGWELIAYCPWCMSFWVTLGLVGWGYGTDWDLYWWLVNSIFAGAYLAAMTMVRDGDDSDDSDEDND